MGLKGRMKANVCAGVGRGDKQLLSSIGIFGQPGGKKGSHRKRKVVRLQDLVLEVPHRILK